MCEMKSCNVAVTKPTGVPEERAAPVILLKMEAVRLSETSIYFETTWRNIPEGCNLHTRRRENLKYHNIYLSTL
jgi:hypothetical protein